MRTKKGFCDPNHHARCEARWHPGNRCRCLGRRRLFRTGDARDRVDAIARAGELAALRERDRRAADARIAALEAEVAALREQLRAARDASRGFTDLRGVLVESPGTGDAPVGGYLGRGTP